MAKVALIALIVGVSACARPVDDAEVTATKTAPTAAAALPVTATPATAATSTATAVPTVSQKTTPQRIGTRVAQLLHLTGKPQASISRTVADGAVVRVFWREAGSDVEQMAVVSRDGRWLSRHPVEIAARLQQLRRDRALSDCLGEAGVRILLDDGEPSKQLAQELGYFSSLLTVDCGGAHGKRCERLGHRSFPTILWPDSAWNGLKKRSWFEGKFACATLKSPMPTTHKVAQQLRVLHELGSGKTTFVLGATRQGDVLTITLRRLSDTQSTFTEIVSADGRWLLTDAVQVEQALANARVLRRRVSCLAKVGARIYINDDSAETRGQLMAIGPLVRYLVHDCRDKQPDKRPAPICKKLKKLGFPALVVGDQVVAKKLLPAAIARISACP